MTEPATISAREAILSRIESALGPKPIHSDPADEWSKLPRTYVRADSLTGPAIVELFEDRLRDYGARVFHCAPDHVAETVIKVLAHRGAKQILIPVGLPPRWLPPEFNFIQDANLPYEKLDRFDGVLTAATVAIAATGSIVLQHGPGQGRRALTLIPDYHLCIIAVDQIVQTVPAAFSRLDPARPTTFISGPSATADIEMTRIKGVHGPRFLDVILTGAGEPQ